MGAIINLLHFSGSFFLSKASSTDSIVIYKKGGATLSQANM